MANEIESALEKCSQMFGKCYVLKDKQKECIVSLQESKDTICILPTGYGKTLIYEILPFLKCNTLVIVINPLNSILYERVEYYGERAIVLTNELVGKVCNGKGHEDECGRRLIAADLLYLLGHPEQVLDKRMWPLYKSSIWQNSVKYICIDECHCIVQWGTNFRKKYNEIGRLRSIFPSASFLCMTATATKRTQRAIADNLLMDCPTYVCGTIDRPNIRIEVKMRPSSTGSHSSSEQSFLSVVNPIIRELTDKVDCFDKTVVYASLKWCGLGYELATMMDEKMKPFVSQYHAVCSDEVRNTNYY